MSGTPRYQKVTVVDGWVLLTRTWDDRPGAEWVLTPVGTIEGPTLVFDTAERATVYASRHSRSE